MHSGKTYESYFEALCPECENPIAELSEYGTGWVKCDCGAIVTVVSVEIIPKFVTATLIEDEEEDEDA